MTAHRERGPSQRRNRTVLPPFPAPRTIEHFVTERYCLYNVERGKVYRVPIHHLPWSLQPAEAEIARNTMAAANGIALPATEPRLHFARELVVLCWTPERAG